MLNNVNALPRSNAYPNCSSLIQSSGYGKSRLMDELVKLVFTIPFNIRNPEERNSQSGMCVYLLCTVELLEGAYPPADPDVWEYLCRTHIKDVEGAEDLVALFLSKLFHQVASEVSHAFSWSQLVQPEKDFAKCWRQYLLGEVPRTPSTLTQYVLSRSDRRFGCSGVGNDSHIDMIDTQILLREDRRRAGGVV